MSLYALDKLMAETRRLAAEYRRTTGKTLAVSGELAVFDAARLLGLTTAPEGCGYDVVRAEAELVSRLQVKARVIFDEQKGGQRLGQLRTDQPWDGVLLVLMDEAYEPVEIWEAERAPLLAAIEEAQNTARAKRGPLSVARFKHLGRLVWSPALGAVGDAARPVGDDHYAP
jgi:hypothetical protein